MSWTMWHVYGHGFRCDDITTENMVEFCKNHKESLQNYARISDLKALLSDLEQLREDDLPFYASSEFSEITDNNTVGEIIAHVIWTETHVSVCSPGNTDEGDDILVFTEAYPWNMTKEDKDLENADAVYDLLRPYAKELGAEDTLDEYDLVYSG